MPEEAKLNLGFLDRLLGGEKKARPSAPPPFAEARVLVDSARCVQCGVCSYNCPMGVSVRDFARQGLAVSDPNCVQCGQCIEACPRGTLRWGRATFRAGTETET